MWIIHKYIRKKPRTKCRQLFWCLQRNGKKVWLDSIQVEIISTPNQGPKSFKAPVVSPSPGRVPETGDECQILCIWTPWFALVRPLALLFSDVLVSFCVFVFCRSIRNEWQISWGNTWKFESPEKSINRNFPELTFADAHQNTQSGASPWQKAFLPLIFAGEHAGFVTLVVSSKRGTLERVDESFYMGF